MTEREIPSSCGQLLVFFLVCFRDEWTNDQQERIRLFPQSDRKSPEQIIDPLKSVQHAGVHDDRAAIRVDICCRNFSGSGWSNISGSIPAGTMSTLAAGTPWSMNQS